MSKELRQYVKGWLEVVIGWLEKERKPAPPIPHLWRDYLGPIMFCFGLALAIPGAIIIAGNTHQMMSTEEAAANPPTDLEKSVYNSPCPKNTDLRASDLCAQWKAADAARKAAEWGVTAFIVGTIVNVLTLIGVAFGWMETRKASMASIKQVEIAQLQLDMTNVSLDISREEARQNARAMDFQLRAWISLAIKMESIVQRKTFEETDVMTLRVGATIKNHGASPAVGLRFYAKLDIWKASCTNEKSRNNFTAQCVEQYTSGIGDVDSGPDAGVAVFPSQEHGEDERISLDWKEILACINDNDYFYPLVICVVLYRTSGNHEVRHTALVFDLRDALGQAERMKAIANGVWTDRKMLLGEPGLMDAV
ncbi:hypothetical protein [Asticcacaulis sp.]|uniref:hypothetical protein n=1 Tax=Asticcacaulis sp. TaxID=1872648 RepID=UPI002C7952E9|nr:hypothetical protein [Asticcacaulis sp.]HTM81965.1 hypothetical protein [Asticcacaulis sp.]